MYDKDGVRIVKEKLEKGYYGIGETVAASSYSPLTSKLLWKSLHPMDGNLPAIYELCAVYKVPILLHIDPPFGEPITRLEEALTSYPKTIFIFAHANVFNPPENIENLLKQYNNLYIDFFAGFTAYDPSNKYPLEDYIELIKRFPEQFLLSTDSATAQNLTYEKAINAMFEVIDLCDDLFIGDLIGRTNFINLIEDQPPTESQINVILRNKDRIREALNVKHLNKRMANEIIIRNHLHVDCPH
jgi:hypothetical protein